jgi:hypothetical protein
LNSLFVYSANLVASFSAGALMASYGWQAVNLACLPLLIGAVLALWSRGDTARQDNREVSPAADTRSAWGCLNGSRTSSTTNRGWRQGQAGQGLRQR